MEVSMETAKPPERLEPRTGKQSLRSFPGILVLTPHPPPNIWAIVLCLCVAGKDHLPLLGLLAKVKCRRRPL